MKKNLIVVSIASLLAMVVAILFIYNSHKKVDDSKTKDFCVVHGSTFVYPFEIAVPKGSSYQEAIFKLKTNLEVNHIYKKSGKSWTEVYRDDPIEYDCQIKVEE